MFTIEGGWNLVTDWKQQVQRFGGGRALTWSGDQERLGRGCKRIVEIPPHL